MKADCPKMGWMALGESGFQTAENYLLGRPVESKYALTEQLCQKSVEGTCPPANNVQHECLPMTIRSHHDVKNNEQVDLQRKISEDPLTIIRKNEEQFRGKLFENPAKLKRFHMMLKTKPKSKKAKQNMRDFLSKETMFIKQSQSYPQRGNHLDEVLERKWTRVRSHLCKMGKSKDFYVKAFVTSLLNGTRSKEMKH